jgi:hypothetical protein
MSPILVPIFTPPIVWPRPLLAPIFKMLCFFAFFKLIVSLRKCDPKYATQNTRPKKCAKRNIWNHRNKYMEEKFHSKKFSHSHRVSISFQCIRPEFRSVLLSFFLCGISLPYIYFYVWNTMEFGLRTPPTGPWTGPKVFLWWFRSLGCELSIEPIGQLHGK